MQRTIIPLALAAAFALARARRDWGACAIERVARMAGDDLVSDPADVTTRAVTIYAPADVVWRWLIQLGQDRGGFYSYDRLENLFRLHIFSARRIHPEWQRLRDGDTVRLVPRGWLGLADGLAMPVARIEEGSSLVLSMPADSPWDAIWSFHVLPLGPDRCRLISRSRSARGNSLVRLANTLMDPITLIMTRRMLLGIKQRAEQDALASRNGSFRNGSSRDGRRPACATATE